MIVGQVVRGFVEPYVIVPTLPEMIDVALVKYPDDEIAVNDLSSGVFNSFLGIGQVAGPLFGALMTEAYGFRVTTDVMGIITLIYALVYFVVGEGPAAFKQSKCKKKKTVKASILGTPQANLLP